MIQSYDELKTRMADWLLRGDLADRIPEFIQLAEARFQRVLRGREMIVRSVAEASGQYIELPSDWIKAKNIQRVKDGVPLRLTSMNELDLTRVRYNAQPSSMEHLPAYYSFSGDALEIAPAATPEGPVEIEMVYYARLVPLSDEQQTNWLLTYHPDIYLYEALTHSAPYLQDDPRLATWQSLANAFMTELNASEENSRWSGAPMSRRIQNNLG